VRDSRELLVETFGDIFVLPNTHTGRHQKDQADDFTLLTNVWTKPDETRHLMWKRLMKKMNWKDVERDLMRFEQERAVSSHYNPMLLVFMCCVMSCVSCWG
jgi:hypothetical protein